MKLSGQVRSGRLKGRKGLYLWNGMDFAASECLSIEVSSVLMIQFSKFFCLPYAGVLAVQVFKRPPTTAVVAVGELQQFENDDAQAWSAD